MGKGGGGFLWEGGGARANVLNDGAAADGLTLRFIYEFINNIIFVSGAKKKNTLCKYKEFFFL